MCLTSGSGKPDQLAPLVKVVTRQVPCAVPPSHWVWTLQHGDVIIADTAPEAEMSRQSPVVMASAKTLRSLQVPAGSVESGKVDPWLHKDPWQSTKSTKELSAGQVAAIETNLEQRLLAKIAPGDHVMEDDSKIMALEQRVEDMQQSFEAFQRNHTQQNQQMQSQLDQHAQFMQGLDRKVDAQTERFTQSLDSKLNDQMHRIEQLMMKSRRTAE